jgi:hypothetical protein
MTEFLDRYLGQTLPGGCADCDAQQTLHREPDAPNLFRLHIEHDDTCPTYRRLKREGLAR